jgi:hypothetical protein
MKTRFVLSMLAVGALLATQGLVGCGSDTSGTQTGKGGATSSGGAIGSGGITSRGGATGSGGAIGNGGAVGVGGSTVPRDGGRPDSATNRDTAREDTNVRRDTARNDTTTACGGEGEPCCPPDNTCNEGLTCERQGGERVCVRDEEPVDSGRRNDTAVRNDTARNDTARNDTARNETATDCGDEGEPCCPPDNTCNEGLTCERQGGERVCVEDTPVDGGRNRDTNVRRDTAADAPACGGLDEDCCAGRECDDGLVCRGGGTGTCEEAAVDGGGGPGGGP